MLHTVNRSPSEVSVLDTCMRYLREGDALLLYEDAVYAALEAGEWAERLAGSMPQSRILVLQPDLEARGLLDRNLVRGVERVDYAGFVELVTQHEPVQCWR